MTATIDRFYLIVGDVDWVARLVPLGVRLVQLRIKEKTDSEIRTQIEISKSICTQHGAQLVINDFWEIALDMGCDYVHLGQEDLNGADTAALRKAGLKLGISTHDEDELERALSFNPDYVALGPVYPTLLKKMPWAPQGLDKLTTWKQRIGDIPLVGIGGVTIERLDGVFEAGADSAAVVTDIMMAEHPEVRTRDWITATRQKVRHLPAPNTRGVQLAASE